MLRLLFWIFPPFDQFCLAVLAVCGLPRKALCRL